MTINELAQLAEQLKSITSKLEDFAKLVKPQAVLEELHPLDRAKGRSSCSQVAEYQKPSQFRIIEVTGKKHGEYIDARWFKLDEREEAKAFLLSLDQGNAWVSEGWLNDCGFVNTKNRKRTNLFHPHAIFEL
jgi:hypothetical protein